MKAENHFKSIRRAISVLKCFTPQELELSGTEVAHKVGIHKTTAHRMLATLSEYGLLERNLKTGKYRVGPTLYVLGSLYLSTTDVLIAAEPVIKALNDMTGENVSLGILDKCNVILIMREESHYLFRWAVHIGTSLPAHASAMGKALLSTLNESELDRLFPEDNLRLLTNKTITTKTKLKLELAQIRSTGVSFDKEGIHKGIEAIGSEIRDASGRAIAAMSIPLPVFRLNRTYRKCLSELIKLGTGLVSYRLGYQDMERPIHDIAGLHIWWEQNKAGLAFPASNLAWTASSSLNSATLK